LNGLDCHTSSTGVIRVLHSLFLALPKWADSDFTFLAYAISGTGTPRMFGRSLTAVLAIALAINGGQARQPARDPSRHHTHHAGSGPIDTSNYRFLTDKTKRMLCSHPSSSMSTDQSVIFPQLMWWRVYRMFISSWGRCTRGLCRSVKMRPCFIFSSRRSGNQATISQFG
jgi:hypothetical protein